MRRHLLAVLAVAVVGGLGLFVGGCSSGCGHCDDPCYDECYDGCHDGCAEVVCEPCGACLDTWYACPCHGYTSAYPGACIHCGAPLEVRHAGCSVSPEGCEGWHGGGYGWQVELAQAERGAQRQVAQAPAPKKSCNCPECTKKAAAAKACNCPECTKKAAAAKHHDCPECAKKAAAPQHSCPDCAQQAPQHQKRTVVRQEPAPKPMSAPKARATVKVDG